MQLDPAVTGSEPVGPDVEVGLGDVRWRGPAIALRDLCRCPACVHPSGQRLIDVLGHPAGLRIARHRVVDDRAIVEWAPDGHVSSYTAADLAGSPVVAERAVTLWGAPVSIDVPAAALDELDASAERRRSWMHEVVEVGFGVVRRVPVADGEVTRLAARFGFVRVTNYGTWFDVRSVVDPTNLAYTSLGLAPHTDNPYRDPVPTMQWLHCLDSTVAGGDNVLVDGWALLAHVRSTDPAAFEALTTVPVTFEFEDPTTHLVAVAPVADVDASGAVRGIRINHRSMRHIGERGRDGALGPWYRGLIACSTMAADPAWQVRFHLEPGDAFVVDNRRVLHGRTGFDPAAGRRHLQGCYADIDGWRSTLAVLERDLVGRSR